MELETKCIAMMATAKPTATRGAYFFPKAGLLRLYYYRVSQKQKARLFL